MTYKPAWNNAGAAAAGQMNGRIERTDADTLTLARYNGDSVEVDGEDVSIGGGITLDTTDNLIDADGLDAAAAMAVNTLYYVYLSNSEAEDFPGELRGSATAPTRVNGVWYLGSGTNAKRWRFVGWVRTISNGGTPEFADSETQRLVVNYYNRLRKRMYSNPGYNNNNGVTNLAYNTATFARYNGGTGDRFDFIANGEDAVEVVFSGTVSGGSNNGQVGWSFDGEEVINCQAFPEFGFRSTFSLEDSRVLAAGHHTADAVAAGSSPISFEVDGGRKGQAADSPETHIRGAVMV